MMNKALRLISATLATALLGHVPAGATSGREGASFLEIPVGAAPAAMGGAYTALATDAYAPVWNPAGLAFVDGTQVAGQHLSYLESIHYEFLGLAQPLSRDKPSLGTIGASAQYLGSGDIAGMAEDGTELPDYSASYGAYSLSYGRPFGERLSLGVTGKAIHGSLADESATAFAADFGGFFKASDRLSLAAALVNAGTSLKFIEQGDSLPLALRLGGAFMPLNGVTVSAEADYAKAAKRVNGRLGVEWKPIEMIALRAGYRTDTLEGLSALAGMSTGIGIGLWGHELAYAWVPYGDLGSTQYFSLVMRFGTKAKERAKLIKSPAIKRHKNAKGDDPEVQQLIELLKSGEQKNVEVKDGK